MVDTTIIKYGCSHSAFLVSCKSATSSRVVLVHAAMWWQGLGFILERRTGEYMVSLQHPLVLCCSCRILEGRTRECMVKGKPCGFWAGCGQHCPVNLISSVPICSDMCALFRVFGDSVVGEWHHKVWSHYAIITTTTMAQTWIWASWSQMSALSSTPPSHTL